MNYRPSKSMRSGKLESNTNQLWGPQKCKWTNMDNHFSKSEASDWSLWVRWSGWWNFWGEIGEFDYFCTTQLPSALHEFNFFGLKIDGYHHLMSLGMIFLNSLWFVDALQWTLAIPCLCKICKGWKLNSVVHLLSRSNSWCPSLSLFLSEWQT